MGKLKTFLVIILLCPFEAYAALDYGAEFGIRRQSGDTVVPAITTNSQTGLQFGGFVHFPFEGSVAHFRTGVLYTQRPLQTENLGTGVQLNFTLDYLDIPLQLLFKPKEVFGIYFGLSLAMNINSSCSGDPNCHLRDIRTPLIPMVFGVVYKFTPKWGIDFYFDGMSSRVAEGLSDYRAVGLNLTRSLD